MYLGVIIYSHLILKIIYFHILWKYISLTKTACCETYKYTTSRKIHINTSEANCILVDHSLIFSLINY